MPRLLFACLVALTMMAPLRPAVPAEAVILGPGEPLDDAVAERLLAAPLAAALGAEAVRVGVRQPALPLANPYHEDAALLVEDLTLLPGDRFAARIVIRVGAAEPLPLGVSGDLVRLVPVALPSRTLPAGAELGEDDLTVQLFAENRVRADWIVEARDLVGQEALRPLLAGRPVPDDAVTAPRLVRRGEPVKLVFRRGGLSLEAAASAQADGALGAIVAARNEATGAVVRGRVVGRRLLHVEASR